MPDKRKTKKQKNALRRMVIALILIVILFLLLCFVTAGEDEVTHYGTSTIPMLELPKPVPGEQIIEHTGYTLSYNEEYEVASWVAYELTRDEVLGESGREDDFKSDPAVRTGSATLADYRNSGYDRGHLAPAADFKWSEEAMSDTFYLSNMTPQEGGFNRGIWADLESVVRTFAYDNGSVYVVTGPVLTDGPYKTIGSNDVAVPKRFYKVVLDYTEPDYKAIGFVLPNEKSDKKLQSYAMSVDEVEEITGLDFFPALPDDHEERLEGHYDVSLWSFNKFYANGEKPSADASYVTSSDPSAEDSLIESILDLFVVLKTAIFEYFNIEDLARSLGLL